MCCIEFHRYCCCLLVVRVLPTDRVLSLLCSSLHTMGGRVFTNPFFHIHGNPHSIHERLRVTQSYFSFNSVFQTPDESVQHLCIGCIVHLQHDGFEHIKICLYTLGLHKAFELVTRISGFIYDCILLFQACFQVSIACVKLVSRCMGLVPT